MGDLQNVPHSVIGIVLDVIPHCLPVCWQRLVQAWQIVAGCRWVGELTDMLAAGGDDQTIESIAGVVGIGCNNLIAEINSLLRRIPDGSDISCWIV